MAPPISDINVSLNEDHENQIQARGFTRIDVNLNGAGGKVYLWYRRGKSSAITRMQLSFNDHMINGLQAAGYHKIDRNLNTGAGGSDIFLWFFSGSTEFDVHINELYVSTDTEDAARKFAEGWEQLACDLNRNNDGDVMFLFLKRDQPISICDITATAGFDGDAALFEDGYIRVDEDTNREAGGAWVFIWFRHTSNPEWAVRDLKLSTNQKEFDEIRATQYQQVDQDLNQGLREEVYLWLARDGAARESIRTFTLIPYEAKEAYQRAGVQVVDRNLNPRPELGGVSQFLCFSLIS